MYVDMYMCICVYVCVKHFWRHVCYVKSAIYMWYNYRNSAEM